MTSPGERAPRTSRGPWEGIDEVGRRRLLILGALGALKALGLVLLADAIATGVVTVIARGEVLPVVLEGLAGALLRAASVWGLRVASQSASSGVKNRLRSRLAKAYLSRTDGGVGADATLAASGLDELDAYYTQYLPSLVGAATVPLLVGARILAADWVSALVIVITVPLVPLFMALIGLHTRDRVAASLDALGRLSDHLVELARGLPVLVGLARDREQTAALADISDEHRRRSMTALRTAFLSSLALDMIATISVAVVAVFIGVRLLSGELTLQAGLVALILAPECYAPLRDIGAAFHASDTGREALRRVRATLARTANPSGLVRTRGALAVQDLTIRHAGRTTPTIAGLGFRAVENGVTLLAGDSGCGKSSVLAVLAGRGALLDDGSSCTGVITAPPADRIAWMPQHPHFAARRVRDEVALYAVDCSVAVEAGSDAVGDAVPADALLVRVGLLAVADDDPASLSPGEARRLSFARVLAAVDAGAALVLLDEPTAHLDSHSAALVRHELSALRGRTTVVVASHDPAVRPLADVVVTVNGRATPPRPVDHVQPSSDLVDGDVPSTAIPATSIPPTHDAPAAPRARGTASLSELRAIVRPVRLRMLAAVLVGVLSTCFAIALTAVSGWLIVRASQEPAIMYLLVAIVGVRFFGIGRSVLRYAERLLTHDAVFRAVTALRVRLWGALAAAGPAGRTALSPVAALSSLIGAADRVRDLVPRVVQPPIAAVVVLAGAGVTLGVVFGPSAAVIVALAAVGLFGAGLLACAGSRASARRGEAARAAVLGGFTELLGARDDLTPRAARRLRHRLADASAAEARAEQSAARAEGAASALSVFACCAAAIAMLPLSADAVASGALRPELVAILALVPLGLVEPLLDAVASASRAPGLARVLADVRAVTALTPGVVDDPAAGGLLDAVDGIRLDSVSYRYPGAARDAFSAASTRAVRGQWLAVTGPSGSGKSTLLALLLRFADPTSGSYLLRGRGVSADARTLRPASLRTRIAWCPQEGHLFDSTLRANLVIARSRDDAPDDAELLDALERVGLAPLVAALPHGLDTRIGAAGSRLSGGQRQRVAVARTLLTRGDVVLIDEPTAHLDEQASDALMSDLRWALRDRLAVLVTHDAAQVRDADRVLDLGGPAVGGRAISSVAAAARAA
ncbi:thiol reductant ABC exporter subunit CydC [Humibacter albus]|uniref:thiol reductant ABC exporter subunit CydC n=1 Tax=Humibacter albus TaxID=427754 RepID=UPI0003B5FD4D|nr:thiol reductant ABC exporter subunit CydC [Humibacter albus]